MHRENSLDNMALLFLDNSLSLSLRHCMKSSRQFLDINSISVIRQNLISFSFSSRQLRSACFFRFEFLGWRREKGTELIF